MILRRTVWAGLALALEACFFFRTRPLSPAHALAVSLAAALVYLIAAFWALRPAPGQSSAAARSGKGELRWILLAALVFRLTVLPLNPGPGSPLARAQWDGRIQTLGFNPYQYAPRNSLFDPIRPAAPLPFSNLAAYHPPLAELLFRWDASFVGGFRRLKLVPFLFDWLLILLLLRVLRSRGQPAAWVLLYAWAPVAVIGVSGLGGFEPAAGLFALAALHWAGRKPARAAWAVATACALQLYAAVLIVPVFAAGLRTGRKWAASLAWLLLWPALLTLPYLWMNRRFSLGVIVANLRAHAAALGVANAGFFALAQAWFGGRAALVLAAVVVAAAIVLAVQRQIRPLRAGLVILAALLLVMPYVAPASLLWLLPLAALYPEPAWLWWTALVPLAAALGAHGWVLALEYVPLYALLAWQGRHWRRDPAKEEERWASA